MYFKLYGYEKGPTHVTQVFKQNISKYFMFWWRKYVQRGVKSNTPEYNRKIDVSKILEDSADVFVWGSSGLDVCSDLDTCPAGWSRS